MYLPRFHQKLKISLIMLFLIFSKMAIAQEKTQNQTMYKTELEYVQAQLRNLFSNEIWKSEYIDDNLDDGYNDKNWFARYFTKTGQTRQGAICQVKVYQSVFFDSYQFARPLVEYSDATGLKIVHRGSLVDTQKSDYNHESNQARLVVYREGGSNCADYGCDSPWHTEAVVRRDYISLSNLLDYQPEVSCHFESIKMQ